MLASNEVQEIEKVKGRIFDQLVSVRMSKRPRSAGGSTSEKYGWSANVEDPEFLIGLA